MNILKVFTKQRELGDVGEAAARKYLKRKRYKILEKNYVAQNNEVDIIAESRDHIVFVEVKTRTYKKGVGTPRESRPALAVTDEKKAAIIKVAKCYLPLKA